MRSSEPVVPTLDDTDPGARRRSVPGRAALDGLAGPAGVQIRATFRVLLAAVIGATLLVTSDSSTTAAATIVPLFAGLYVLVSTAVAWPRAGARTDPRLTERADTVRAALDIVAVCAVAASVDRPRMAILMVLCAIPLGYGLTLPASAVVTLTAIGVTGALVLWAIAPSIGAVPLGEGSLLLLSFALAWCGLIASLIAIERERRAQRIRKLSGSVRDMLRQALRAETTERTRVADLLHDDVLQLLMATRHDISDAIDGDLTLLPEARAGIEAATRRLRETIEALRDEPPADQGLGEGLRGIAADATEARGVAVELTIDPVFERAPHPILLTATRDLFRDAESSSAARTIAMVVVRTGDSIAVELRHHDPRHALGLAPSDDSVELLHDVGVRVIAVDGTITVSHSSTSERRVVVRVPERPERQEPATTPSAATGGLHRRSLRSRSSTDQPTQKLG